ncbi:NAD-dependent epimerase/dehydratase family protein [Salidesulfovibrio onnuriiensis]|uniref:NAD-dependent epimerase/dehydratase family protein n=1 Tax=Salidesulfovibrio onnuriiensis TaxID=2583823 RepID=UPI0011CBFDB1|nr:NAD-dependent epimerase/dehydratase family protein [Salidesulfovibrio onnuriiensis]
MKKVLVTGGCGFIGANLLPMLLARDCEVRILDSLVLGKKEYVAGLDVELQIGDIRNSDDAARAVKGMDTVIHLAAFGSVVASVQDPKTNFDMNPGGTLNMLQASVQAEVEQFVFSSTGGALIGNAEPPVNENSLPRPISPYGAGKLACEGYLNAFAGSYGLKTKIMRFANAYGPYSGHKLGAVTAFIKAVHAGEPITIYGDGSATRDFLYVDDLCAGITAMAETEVEPASVLHLASGRETSVLELAHLIAETGGSPNHEITLQPNRPGEVQRNFAAYDRAREMLGFEPAVSLEQGLEKTWAWYREHVLR